MTESKEPQPAEGEAAQSGAAPPSAGAPPSPEALSPEAIEAQRQALKDEAVTIMTWWRCAGCLGVIGMIAIGSVLGIWLTLRSDVFQNDPWVTPETLAEDASLAAVTPTMRSALQEAAASGRIRGSAAALTVVTSDWLSATELADENSLCHIRFVEAGVAQLTLSFHVPAGLPFPGSLMEGAYYNIALTFAGTYDRSRPELLDLRKYRIGERPEAPIDSVDDARALGAAIQRFIAWHPELEQTLNKITRITVHDDECEILLTP